MSILQVNSCSIDQESGGIWTVQTDLQQIYSKSDSLLEFSMEFWKRYAAMSTWLSGISVWNSFFTLGKVTLCHCIDYSHSCCRFSCSPPAPRLRLLPSIIVRVQSWRRSHRPYPFRSMPRTAVWGGAVIWSSVAPIKSIWWCCHPSGRL